MKSKKHTGSLLLNIILIKILVIKGAEERFEEISEGYEVLIDPEKRKKYDTIQFA